MAYNFNGSNQSLETSSAPTNNDTVTICAWFNTSNLTQNSSMVCLTDKDSSTDEYYLSLLSGEVRAVKKSGGSTNGVITTTSYSANTWHHGAATFEFTGGSSVALVAYLDGGGKGSDISSGRPTIANFDNATIGSLNRVTDILHYTGDLAEVAMWDVILPDEEIAILAQGFSPLLLTHRLKNLVLYKPIIRELNGFGLGPSLTNNNSATVVDHTRVIYPTMSFIGIPQAVPPVGGNEGAAMYHHLQNMGAY